ncbi:MAG: hypothetical protein OEU54_00630 [Gemmatimonadota bacterium]|nr:hypothetical protein [Gemmatimonadota bacterium]
MSELKALSLEAIPRALEQAKQYRLLNEPEVAESVCVDILEVDADNQGALVQLLLAQTEQFERDSHALDRAKEVLPRLEGTYQRAYYAGLACERQAKALLKHRARKSGVAAYHWFERALEHYGRAIEERAPGDDDAILRWNTCVRMVERHPHCRPETTGRRELGIE